MRIGHLFHTSPAGLAADVCKQVHRCPALPKCSQIPPPARSPLQGCNSKTQERRARRKQDLPLNTGRRKPRKSSRTRCQIDQRVYCQPDHRLPPSWLFQ